MTETQCIANKFFEEHYEIISSEAKNAAVKIARSTGLWSDIDDHVQTMYCAVLSRAPKFDPARGKARTFINVVVYSAAADIVRRHFASARHGAYSLEHLLSLGMLRNC